MKYFLLALLTLLVTIMPALAAGTAPKTPAPPARSKVDPALEAEHDKEDIKRHRQMAAAHEAAANCQESGKDEEFCNAALAKACQGIAYGKFCGMKHPE